MNAIFRPDQPELPIAQKLTCRRCRGAGSTYYAQTGADVVGGKRIECPECNGSGTIDLADQLFRTSVTAKTPPVKPSGKTKAGTTRVARIVEPEQRVTAQEELLPRNVEADPRVAAFVAGMGTRVP